MAEDFYERLKRLCKEHDYSIEGLMLSCDLTKDAYAKWRRRGTFPRANNLLDMSRKLGVSMEYLMTGAEYEIPPRLREIVQILKEDEDKLVAIESLLMVKKSGSSGIKVS